MRLNSRYSHSEITPEARARASLSPQLQLRSSPHNVPAPSPTLVDSSESRHVTHNQDTCRNSPTMVSSYFLNSGSNPTTHGQLNLSMSPVRRQTLESTAGRLNHASTSPFTIVCLVVKYIQPILIVLRKDLTGDARPRGSQLARQPRDELDDDGIEISSDMEFDAEVLAGLDRMEREAFAERDQATFSGAIDSSTTSPGVVITDSIASKEDDVISIDDDDDERHLQSNAVPARNIRRRLDHHARKSPAMFGDVIELADSD